VQLAEGGQGDAVRIYLLLEWEAAMEIGRHLILALV
jgi:hypothetical protein